jgi:hypothetical protein
MSREAMQKAFQIIGVLKPDNFVHRQLQGEAWDALRQELAKLAEPPDYVEPPTSDYHNGWEEGFEAAKNLFKGKST